MTITSISSPNSSRSLGLNLGILTLGSESLTFDAVTCGDRIPKHRCGTNPDFIIDKQGSVHPVAVDSKLKQRGGCTKVGVSTIFMRTPVLMRRRQGKFSMDLGKIVEDYLKEHADSSSSEGSDTESVKSGRPSSQLSNRKGGRKRSNRG